MTQLPTRGQMTLVQAIVSTIKVFNVKTNPHILSTIIETIQREKKQTIQFMTVNTIYKKRIWQTFSLVIGERLFHLVCITKLFSFEILKYELHIEW